MSIAYKFHAAVASLAAVACAIAFAVGLVFCLTAEPMNAKLSFAVAVLTGLTAILRREMSEALR